MSISHSVWALREAPARTAAERLALIYLAEHVSDERRHRGAMPSLADLGAVLCMGEADAARVLVDLVLADMLRLVDLVRADTLRLGGTVFELNLGGRNA